MALINCPECGKEISNQAICCIYCGYPLNSANIKDGICIIDNKEHDLRVFREEILGVDSMTFDIKRDISYKLARHVGTISALAARELIDIIRNTGKVPETYDGSHLTFKVEKDDGLVHCPKCNSTAITTGSRGYSIVWGFIGAGKTVNRCARCGYKWTPRK